jgi:hypothetical protein
VEIDPKARVKLELNPTSSMGESTEKRGGRGAGGEGEGEGGGGHLQNTQNAGKKAARNAKTRGTVDMGAK